MDLILRDAQVVDGTGAPPFRADVGIAGDRIASIGNLADARADTTLRLSGSNICPGFIDVHTHDDAAVLVEPEMTPKISQGVTSVIVGNCGFSLAPLNVERLLPPEFDLLGDVRSLGCASLAEYIGRLKETPPAVNVGILVGHSALRTGAMTDLSRNASSDETDAMRAALVECLKAGALGMSTGLEYQCAAAASTDEIISLASMLPAYSGIYVTHMRDHYERVPEAVEEALTIGRAAAVPVILSHHQVAGRLNYGRSLDTLALIDAAAKLQPVGLDAYPYIAGATIIIPSLVDACERVVIAWSQSVPSAAGRDLSDLAAEWNCSLQEAATRLRPGGAIYFDKSEEDVRRILLYPRTMIGSDGLFFEKVKHPRLWGTFPRMLGYYARDLGLMPFEEAVHRMTGLPAATFGLQDRGIIKQGAFADLVVLNRDRITDNATYAMPERAASGIDLVMVNGEVVWKEGRATGGRPGVVLMKPQTGTMRS